MIVKKAGFLGLKMRAGERRRLYETYLFENLENPSVQIFGDQKAICSKI